MPISVATGDSDAYAGVTVGACLDNLETVVNDGGMRAGIFG